MAKSLAELRAVLKAGDEYACHSFVQLTGKGDIYSGPCGDKASEVSGKPAFRASYHEKGLAHLYYNLIGKRVGSQKRTPPAEINGIEFLGGSPSGLDRDWSYKPKKDAATRRSMILDLDHISVPFTVDAWAFAPDDPSLWDEILSQPKYSKEWLVILGHVCADWCAPNLALIAYSLTDAAWRSAPHYRPKTD